MMGKVVHCKKARYDVYVGRPSKWGNPFVLGRDGGREEVIAKYERWLDSQPQLLADLPSLAGLTLACWCSPLACHADVLVRRAREATLDRVSTVDRLLICGSRTVTDRAAVWSWLDDPARPHAGWAVTVVTGGARGADSLGHAWAQRRGFRTQVFPAAWDLDGRAAGFIRNERMLRSGLDAAYAFVDKPLALSRGTAHMVGLCRRAGVPVTVVELSPGRAVQASDDLF